MRWCTRQLKIKPFEDWIGDDEVISYVGVRADEEDRKAYVVKRPTVTAVYPFIEDRIYKEDVFRILEESGVGVPEYYKWRSRSGCYFCFFQRKAEWVGLKERHPELFEMAKAYEKTVEKDGLSHSFSWSEGESLSDIEQPARVADIKRRHELALQDELRSKKNRRLMDLVEAMDEALGQENDDEPCTICSM